MNRIEFDKGLVTERPSSTLLHPANASDIFLQRLVVNVMEPFWSKDSFRLDAEDCETQSKNV